MSEQHITNDIITFLNMLPMSYSYETTTTGGVKRGRVVTKAKLKGKSDIVWTYWGIDIKLETKKPKDGVQSPDQKDFQDDVERNGGLYFLPESIDDVRRIIKWINSQKWFQIYKKERYGV